MCPTPLDAQWEGGALQRPCCPTSVWSSRPSPPGPRPPCTRTPPWTVIKYVFPSAALHSNASQPPAACFSTRTKRVSGECVSHTRHLLGCNGPDGIHAPNRCNFCPPLRGKHIHLLLHWQIYLPILIYFNILIPAALPKAGNGYFAFGGAKSGSKWAKWKKQYIRSVWSDNPVLSSFADFWSLHSFVPVWVQFQLVDPIGARGAALPPSQKVASSEWTTPGLLSNALA